MIFFNKRSNLFKANFIALLFLSSTKKTIYVLNEYTNYLIITIYVFKNKSIYYIFELYVFILNYCFFMMEMYTYEDQ